MSKTLDLVYANKLTGDAALTKELLDMLYQSLDEHLIKINTAWQRKDYAVLRENVHHLHGATCYTGTLDLKDTCKQLEKSSIEKSDHDIEQYFRLLKEKVAEFKAAYEEL